MDSTTPSSGLYQQMLGEAFEVLPPVLKRFHSVGSITARGVLRVTRGRGLLLGIIATVMRLPLSGEQVPLFLQVDTRGGVEYWTRDFDKVRLQTTQWRQYGLLMETAGPMRFGFRLVGDDTGMRFEFVRGWLGLIPVPAFLCPRVEAVTTVQEEGWWVQVSINLPVLGRLMEYEGKVIPEW